MNYWHIQMFKPNGPGGATIDSRKMLEEEPPLIGTGEWEDKQCVDFKNSLQKEDIVLVREGQKPLALVKVTGESFTRDDLKKKYGNINYRTVAVLLWCSKRDDWPKTQGTLERLINTGTASYEYINELYLEYKKGQNMQERLSLLRTKKQIILQGAPGTGKTYSTADLAVRMIDGDKTPTERKALMERYQNLVKEKRIFFTTFHPSLDYEEFVEGYKPVTMIVDETTNQKALSYEIIPGIFKKACGIAQDLWEKEAAQKHKKLSIEVVLLQLCEELQKEKAITINSYDGSIQYNISFDSEEGDEPRIKFKSTNDNPEKYRSLTHIKNKYYEYNDQAKIGNYPYPRALIKYMIDNMDLINPAELETIQEEAKEKHVILIIDEINRGHISKIFGELITLLEADKRRGEDNELPLTLPYSKESFTVPPNLYIIGTMNTSDRTIGYIDYALRRRFAFVTIPASLGVITDYYAKIKQVDLGQKALGLFNKISDEIITDKKNSGPQTLAPEFEKNDLMIGHSYFMAEDEQKLQMKLEYEIRPLLLEYLKDGILIGGEELKSVIKKLSL